MKFRLSTNVSYLFAYMLMLMVSTAAFAEPVGEMLPLSESGKSLLAMSGASIEAEAAKIPTKEKVGLPVYPGSYYTALFTGEGMYPSVTLVSSDGIEAVKAWYEKQDGLTWNDMFGLFYAGKEYKMMLTESVYLQDISEDPTESTGGLAGYDMTGMKTQITISYKP